jgi:ribosomal protein S18 acetylase RimI-like enzyme
VAPTHRRRGVARRMLTAVLEDLVPDDVTQLALWVLDGNEAAVAVYRRLGFSSTGIVQPLDEAGMPGRSEERLVRHLRG